MNVAAGFLPAGLSAANTERSYRLYERDIAERALSVG